MYYDRKSKNFRMLAEIVTKIYLGFGINANVRQRINPCHKSENKKSLYFFFIIINDFNARPVSPLS